MSRKVNVHYTDGSSRKIKVKNSIESEKIKNEKYLERKTTHNRRLDSFDTGVSIFGLIVGILIFISLIRTFGGYGSMSFASLLETLANAPNIQMPLNKVVDIFTFNKAWPVLDGLRTFINSLGTIVGVLNWCVLGLYQCVVYLGYFIGFIFVA